MTAPRSNDAPGWGLPIVAALIALVIQLPIYDRWYGLLDEGYMLALADDIGRGQRLYRDIYVDAPWPAAFHVLARWFSLAGTSVWAERVLLAERAWDERDFHLPAFGRRGCSS